MAAQVYGFYITVSHRVDVIADSLEEAEEYAMDAFADDAGLWDDFDMFNEFVEDIDGSDTETPETEEG